MGTPDPKMLIPDGNDVEIHFVVYYSTHHAQWFIVDETDSYLPDGDTWDDTAQEWGQDERYDNLREALYNQAGERLGAGPVPGPFACCGGDPAAHR